MASLCQTVPKSPPSNRELLSSGTNQTYPTVDSGGGTATDSSGGGSSLKGAVAAVGTTVGAEDGVDSEVGTASLGEGAGAPEPLLF